jgi:hypothetical protein
MARCSNKSISKKSSAQSSPSNISTRLPAKLSCIAENNVDDTMLDRKIALVTEDFTTNKYCELLLKDRNRLSKENALTLCGYLIAMKREVNPRASYKKNTMQFIAELSHAVGIEKNLLI